MPYLTGLIMDGTILPIPADVAWATGQFNPVPIISGTVEDEGGFGATLTELFSGHPLTADEYTELITSIYTGNTNIFNGPMGIAGVPPLYPTGTDTKVLARYPLAAYASPSFAEIAVLTDTESCRARHLNHLLSQDPTMELPLRPGVRRSNIVQRPTSAAGRPAATTGPARITTRGNPKRRLLWFGLSSH